MSCSRMENKILPYVDARLKASEMAEVEKHLASCPACGLRVREFRAVSSLLDELPAIEPSPAFDVRVHARVSAEPIKRGWWASFAPAPRVAFAASLLLLATVWLASRPADTALSASDIENINQNMSVLENYDVISDFAPLSELPQPVQNDEAPASDSGENQQQQQM
jgi:anti-sigma factor RsiW